MFALCALGFKKKQTNNIQKVTDQRDQRAFRCFHTRSVRQKINTDNSRHPISCLFRSGHLISQQPVGFHISFALYDKEKEQDLETAGRGKMLATKRWVGNGNPIGTRKRSHV